VVAKEPLTFHGTSGRERPTTAALALVLNCGDGALLSPVHAGREVKGGVSDEKVGWLTAASLETVHPGSELLRSEIGELVEAKLEPSALSVVFSNLSEVALENSITCFFFVLRVVISCVSHPPLVEHLS